MSNKVIPINGDKAVELVLAMVRDWQFSGLTAQDILDEACERALREGVVTQTELNTWSEELAQKERDLRLSQKFPFQPIPPWR